MAKIAETNFKAGTYANKQKEAKAFDERKRKEVHDTLRRHEHPQAKTATDTKKQTQKQAKKTAGDE